MESGVRPITPHLRALEAPAPLANLQAWLMWRYEQFPNEEKPRKVPYWTNGQKRYGHWDVGRKSNRVEDL